MISVPSQALQHFALYDLRHREPRVEQSKLLASVNPTVRLFGVTAPKAHQQMLMHSVGTLSRAEFLTPGQELDAECKWQVQLAHAHHLVNDMSHHISH